MAVFGENNFATPFGVISPSGFFNAQGQGFYDYSGFSSRAGLLGFSGNSGVSGYSSFCGPAGLEFIPFKPILTFPLNFELLSDQVTITWKEAIPRDACNIPVFYEIQFTRSFSLDSGWKTIASDLRQGTTSFIFDVSNIPFTEDAGLRIRARDIHNVFSDWSRSNQAFTIANHAPNPATLLLPLPNDVYDRCIPVVWQAAAIKDIDGHEITYLIEITDDFSANAGWAAVPGATAVPEDTNAFDINCFDFPEGDDYGLRISAVDPMGLSSTPASIGPFSVHHQGSFIIDTLPPQGSISINDGATLAANTQVKLTLFGFDATTGIKDVRFKNAEEDCWSDYDDFAPEKFWDLPKTDGVKQVLVQYRDYANNTSEACDCEIVSRVLCDAGNVTDIEVFNNKLYVAFDVNGNLVEYRVLVHKAAALPEPEITALAKFGNFLFLSTFNQVSGSFIYRFDGKANLVFSIAGAKVLTMQAYNDLLFLGLDNGQILSFDGTNSSVVFASAFPITRLRTDGAVLFASIQGSSQFLTTNDGIVWKVNFI